jgi:toxin ParE1/3/4
MPWTLRLGRQAEQDFADIVRWTASHFGVKQAKTYAQSLSLAIQALLQGPQILGAQARDEIDIGIRVLHIARQGRKGRHFIVFRVGAQQVIEVLRILHDSMDLQAHLRCDTS